MPQTVALVAALDNNYKDVRQSATYKLGDIDAVPKGKDIEPLLLQHYQYYKTRSHASGGIQ